jgi:hypothetical protein
MQCPAGAPTQVLAGPHALSTVQRLGPQKVLAAGSSAGNV